MLNDPILERYRDCWTTSLGLMRRRYLYAPFLAIFAVKIIPLLLGFWYWHPLIAPVMTPIIKSLGGEAILHYPEHITNVIMFLLVITT